jgi:cation:H+ antiporter
MRKSVSLHSTAPFFLLLLLFAEPLRQFSPWSVLWTTPCILLASILITWGAESAQFFVAQGFALAILAWMQTLPEFAIEAVLAWKQQTTLLLANLTGALRLLTGLAWPMIYVTAAAVHRRRTGQPLNTIQLERHHSVEVIALLPPLAYAFFIWWKASLHVFDACVLIAFYAAYLVLLMKLPPQEHETVEDLEAVPRSIVLARRGTRIAAIALCFLVGGTLIYFLAEPFLGSLVAMAGAISIPSFVVIQWLAPVISEFPEFASTFYFARQTGNASVALMNITSSNINQWTLLFAMLPIVFSVSRGTVSGIPFDPQQESELLLTIAQSLVALLFLANMSFCWWEAFLMFVLFGLQFAVPAGQRNWITYAFFAWAAVSVILMILRRRPPQAMTKFVETWREHVG